MPQAISIDNYIDTHSMNHSLVLCGKLGIVRSIIEAERKSKLFTPTGSRFDQKRALNTWYLPFFHLLTENVQRASCDTIFDNVSLIVFNYDRCVEHYLYHALQTYYAIPPEEVCNILKRLVISRPYGLVSFLQWQNVRSYPFGGGYKHEREHETAMRLALVGMADRIQTFTEQVKDHAALARIRKQVQEAETVVFLGFAFHPLNMQLLASGVTSNAKRVFATAKGISSADVAVIK
jgi:hypothetical protein